MSRDLNFFATTPRGIEPLLTEELAGLGVREVRPGRAGVFFRGPLEAGYRACLWSRLASRVLLTLASFPAPTPEDLYAGVRTIDWPEHLDAEGTLAVDGQVAGSRITHSRFAALKVKDAVVDRFREAMGIRPSVDPARPDVRLNVYVHRDRATLSLDLSGESLHRRGYREEKVLAPLKENLAAAILWRAGWPETAAGGGSLVDPMCGSGTLPIEAALAAADIAPGLLRSYFGFLGWRRHDPALWLSLIEEARRRRAEGLARLPAIFGFDADPGAIRIAWANLERAGLVGHVHFERRELSSLKTPPGARPGLVVANPPYGERLGEEGELASLYRELGRSLREQFSGWRAAVFTGNPALGARLGLPVRHADTLYNGPLECRLLHLEMPREESDRRDAGGAPAVPLSPGAQMFANRLRKNLRTLGRWAQREGIRCYRLYDRDLPEYAVAIDLYDTWLHVQEYEAPVRIDPALAEARLQEVMMVLPQVLAVPAERLFLKVRRRQKGRSQYRKMASREELHEVREGNCRFLVNFTDYLDTGLFLDHRLTRQKIEEMAAGRRFLNLFAYTGTATVHAAMGGAVSTVSVDLSRTYLDWARRNLALNGFAGPEHRLVQADCLQWLAEEKGRYDLIFLDPPTFSTSKRMAKTFDVQRDHVSLLQKTAALLASGGVLIFSTNNRHFRLDREALPDLAVEEITRQTMSRDFARNPRIHHCWRITRS